MSMNQVSEPIKSNKILFDKVSIIHDIEKIFKFEMLHLTQFYTNKRGIMNLLCKSVTCKALCL